MRILHRMPTSGNLHLIILVSTILSSTMLAGDLKLGSGHPGLKVLEKKNHLVIYQDEPRAVGVGQLGGPERHVEILFDDVFDCSPRFGDSGPKQLFPFDENSAFTCSGGNWNSSTHEFDCQKSRSYKGYRLLNGKLMLIENVQNEAKSKYGLGSDDEFLGFIDNQVFFWKKFDTHNIYWKNTNDSRVYTIKLPRKIFDLYGVARGVKRGYGVLVFRRTPGLIHWYPNTWSYLELDMSKSKPIGPPNPALNSDPAASGAVLTSWQLTLTSPLSISAAAWPVSSCR